MTASLWQQAGNTSSSIANRLSALRDWSTRPAASNAERAGYVLMFAVLVVVRQRPNPAGGTILGGRGTGLL